jgi:WhiB family transcriptional regulator, redox-sensing transcriptional regulator
VTDDASGGWRTAAACAGLGPRLFYDPTSRSVARAKAVCAGCTVRRSCLAHAMTDGEMGVWGGRTESERAFQCEDVTPIVGRPRLISDAELVALLEAAHPSTCASDVLRRHPDISTASVYRYLITALRLGLVEQRGRFLYPVRRA